MMVRRAVALWVWILAGTLLASAQDVRIGVLGLFQTRQFVLRPVEEGVLTVRTGRETFALQKSAGLGEARFELEGSRVRVTVGDRRVLADRIVVGSRDGAVPEFFLAVPGKITRRYQGVLEITASGPKLVAVIKMDLETAVASVVAAEQTSDVPLEAAKAQAVAARSYFVAGAGRHLDFDFCDTTHCQFLREPPPSASIAAQATSATRGLVLRYQGRPVAAMYTRSCAGHTRALARPDADGYSFYAVECAYCRQHPMRWETRVSAADASRLRTGSESARLVVARRLGWEAVPSSNFTLEHQGDEVLVRGVGYGHGVGLCQAGARAMAEQGANFAEILRRYYPDTVIAGLAHGNRADPERQPQPQANPNPDFNRMPSATR